MAFLQGMETTTNTHRASLASDIRPHGKQKAGQHPYLLSYDMVMEIRAAILRHTFCLCGKLSSAEFRFPRNYIMQRSSSCCLPSARIAAVYIIPVCEKKVAVHALFSRLSGNSLCGVKLFSTSRVFILVFKCCSYPTIFSP